MIKLILPISILIFSSCTKELSIADFASDFENYKSELRVEAILNSNNFSE